MRRSSLVILLSVLISCLPGISRAEIREESFELNPYFGYCTGSNSHVLCHKDFYGLRAGYNITKNWGIEGAFDYAVSTADMFHADVVYHLMPEKRLTPFVVAGVGFADVHPKHGHSYDSVMGNIGIGAKYAISDCVGLRADLRDVQTHSNNVIVSAGLTFTFGGKKPKPVAAAQPVEPKPEPTPLPAPKPEPTPLPAPKPEAAAPPAPVKEPETVQLVLEDVHFGHDKAALTPEAKEILKKNIEILKAHPGMRIEIQGHTSMIGTEEYNMKLSVKRAGAVKDYLVKEGGISPDSLSVKGYGKTEPELIEKYPKKKESNEARTNRRVHFEITVK
ncbi:MAG TPA: OmpA family protein [Thermodesulfovibrionales bacterium]|nr:OmpA family protein [Thermodesulfovibrionales bacterium]